MKKNLSKLNTLALAALLITTFASCKRLDGETVVEGQVVDRHTGQPIPNATVTIHSGKNSSGFAGSAYNTFEFEKQADAKGNFAFSFEGKGDRSYVLRAFKESGYYTTWDDAIWLDEGRNNKKLKVKMQAPAWVRVKLVNTPPKDMVSRLHIQSFSDMINGEDYVTLINFQRDTTFIRMMPGNIERTFLLSVRNIDGNTIQTNPSAYFPALDTTDLVINY